MIGARIAWKESRGSRMRLVFLSAHLAIGVAVLAAFMTFGKMLQDALTAQAQVVLGGDLVLGSPKPFSSETLEFFEKLPGEHSREVSLTTMARTVEDSYQRLVQIRGVDKKFPLFGSIEVWPEEAKKSFSNEEGVLVEEMLRYDLDLKVGSKIKIGEMSYTVLGFLERLPSASLIWESIAPTVLLPRSTLPNTQLLQFGSRAKYKEYLRFPQGERTENILRRNKKRIEQLGLLAETAAERQKSLERISENVYGFLQICGIFVLFLSALGVAHATEVYVNEKRRLGGILRALGAVRSFPGGVVMLQVVIAATCSSIIGAILGGFVAMNIPHKLSAFLPVSASGSISVSDLFFSVLSGVSMSAYIAYVTILSGSEAPPLHLLRSNFSQNRTKPSLYALGLLLAYLLTLTDRHWVSQGTKFLFSALILFFILILFFEGILFAAQKLGSSTFPLGFRYGLRNISRSKKQRRAYVMLIAAAIIFSSSIAAFRAALQQEINLSYGRNSNIVFFDVQEQQRNGVQSILEAGGESFEESPVVTMRLVSVNGNSTKSILNKKENTVPEWTLRREYRSTYRNELSQTEEIVRGDFHSHYEGQGRVPISIEEGLAKKIGVDLGAELRFDVQGVEIVTVISSVRKVQWKRVHANFFFVFPQGVLEEAPQTYIYSTFRKTIKDRALLSHEVVKMFPNISTIDLEGMVKIVNEILNKFSQIINFLSYLLYAIAFMSVCVSSLTLLSTRVRELALLRVLGAHNMKLAFLIGGEYLLLGIIVGLIASILSFSVNICFARYAFDLEPVFTLGGFLYPFLAAILVSLTAAMVCLLALARAKPLELMRLA